MLMLMGHQSHQEEEEAVEDVGSAVGRTEWWIKQLCETDRIIIKRKRRDVRNLIQKFISSPNPSSPQQSNLALMPTKSTSIPRHLHLDWESNWPSTDDFYQQITTIMGLTIPAQTTENSVVLSSSAYNCFDIKSLRTVMENELEQLGVARLQKMQCSGCRKFFSADNLYMKSTVTRCQKCFKGLVPRRSIFDLLIKEIADKWAKMVGKRVECLYGEWDERLNSMVKRLKENVLLAEDISGLLRRCMDPQDLKDACEVIILTTIIFYLEYGDFRRSCEALIKMKPTVTHEQLFEIFTIYFPNRAKGVKTGDFL